MPVLYKTLTLNQIMRIVLDKAELFGLSIHWRKCHECFKKCHDETGRQPCISYDYRFINCSSGTVAWNGAVHSHLIVVISLTPSIQTKAGQGSRSRRQCPTPLSNARAPQGICLSHQYNSSYEYICSGHQH